MPGCKAVTMHSLDWRAGLLAEKIRGHLPFAAWHDMLGILVPRFIVSKPLGESMPLKVLERDTEPCPVLWGTLFGSFWGRETDREALGLVVLEQVFAIYQQGPVRIRPGDVVFDVGGQLGVFTRIALTKGAAKVIVFEPEPTNIACIEKTFAREITSGQVVVVKAAAWKEKGNLRFKGNTLTFRLGAETDMNGSIEVSAVTIDAIAQHPGINRVDFIKMDIEGSERYALAGAEKVLKKYGPRLAISAYHLPDDKDVLPRSIYEISPSYTRYFAATHYDDYLYFFDAAGLR